jgi:hypothetical protein
VWKQGFGQGGLPALSRPGQGNNRVLAGQPLKYGLDVASDHEQIIVIFCKSAKFVWICRNCGFLHTPTVLD